MLVVAVFRVGIFLHNRSSVVVFLNNNKNQLLIIIKKIIYFYNNDCILHCSRCFIYKAQKLKLMYDRLVLTD